MMDEVRLDLGIDYGTVGGPQYSTSIITDGGGGEQRNINWSQPLGKWLLGNRSLNKEELDYFIDFHKARIGSAIAFRFKDWADYKATNQLVGVGNGTQTQFQCKKTYLISSYYTDRPITKIVAGTVRVYFSGIQQLTGWTINNNTGVLTFTTAPTNAITITADFEFDVPVRFEQDALAFKFLAYDGFEHIFQLEELSLVEVRSEPTILLPLSPVPQSISSTLNLGVDYGTVGGPQFNTSITSVGANFEKRVSNWKESKGRWNIGDRTLTRSELDYFINFFRVVRGAGVGFYFKDWQTGETILCRFELDAIAFRFDAIDPYSEEAIFYLAGVAVVELDSPLNGLRWELPCLGDGNHPSNCACAPYFLTTTTFNKNPSNTYNVTLRFRGVIETKAYSGGSNDGAFWQIGGTPSSTDFYNIYKLEISDPPQVFYLNRGASNLAYCHTIDYQKTISIKGGATIFLTVDSADSLQIKNIDSNGNPIPPYQGQYIQMDVVSVVVI